MFFSSANQKWPGRRKICLLTPYFTGILYFKETERMKEIRERRKNRKTAEEER